MHFFRNNKERKILYFILIAFFVVQMWVVLTQGDKLYLGDFNLMDNDDVKYIRSAWTLIEENRFVYKDVNTPTVFIMPGYTMVLAFFMSIFGKVSGIIAVRIFQSILQVISVYLVYSISKEVFNKKVASITLILSVLYMPEIVTPGLILTETVFKFLLILLVYMSLKGLKNKKISFYILGGVIWSLAMMVRPTIGLYPIIILIMMIIYKYSLKDIIVRTLLVLNIFIIIFTPWWTRNYVIFDRFIPFTLSSGNPFLQGTYINYDESKDYVGYKSSSDAIENDKIEMQVGIERLKEYFPNNKLKYIYWYTIGKTIYYWVFPFYYYNLINFPYDIVLYGIVLIYHVTLLFLALSNVLLIKYIKRKEVLLIVGVIVYFNIIYLPYCTFSRYAYPTMPFVIILASNMIYFLTSKIQIRCKSRKGGVAYEGI